MKHEQFKEALYKKVEQCSEELYNTHIDSRSIERDNTKSTAYARGKLEGKGEAYLDAIAMLDGRKKELQVCYVCSPYRDNPERNIEYAKFLTRWAIVLGYSPITPHLYIPQVLDDNIPAQRAEGMAIARELLARCDCILVGDKYGISEGMQAEIDLARKLGLVRIEAHN